MDPAGLSRFRISSLARKVAVLLQHLRVARGQSLLRALGGLRRLALFGDGVRASSARHAAPTTREFVRAHVERVMADSGGNKSRASRVLGISRQDVDRRLASWLAGAAPEATDRAERSRMPRSPRAPAGLRQSAARRSA